jgi:hypothetical protein
MNEKGIRAKGRPFSGIDIAETLGVDPSMVNETIRFNKTSARVRRGIAAFLKAPYGYCWGEPDPEQNDSKRSA